MRLNGGEFLLDFTALSLTDSASSVTISNKEILSALTGLKIYINNQKAIKPVWVKFIDDDTDEIIVARGEIRKSIGDLEFDFFISSKGHSLSIHVEFTQMVDSDSNLLNDYFIDDGDATYEYVSNIVGTKLYKQKIQLEDQANSLLYEFYIINNSPITEETILADICKYVSLLPGQDVNEGERISPIGMFDTSLIAITFVYYWYDGIVEKSISNPHFTVLETIVL